MGIFRNRKLGTKIIMAFLAISFVLLAVGIFQLRSIYQVSVVTESIKETLPLVDAAMEMKLPLLQEQIQKLKMLTGNEKINFRAISNQHKKNEERFHLFAKAMLEGALTDEGMIYAAKNSDLRKSVSEAEKFYDNQFTANFNTIFRLAEEREATLSKRTWSMSGLDKTYEEITDHLKKMEELVISHIFQKESKNSRTNQAKRKSLQIASVIDDILKSIASNRIITEEYLQIIDQETLTTFEASYHKTFADVEQGNRELLREGASAKSNPVEIDEALLKESIIKFNRVLGTYKKYADEMILAHNYSSQITNKLDRLSARSEEINNQIMYILGLIEDIAREETQDAALEGKRIYGVAKIGSVIGILSGFLLSLFLGVFLSWLITRRINLMVHFADKLAKGELPKAFTDTSQDEIGQLFTSLNKMLTSFETVVKQADRISKGNYTVKIVPRSDTDELSYAIINMTKTLKKVMSENQNQNWIKTGETELTNRMRGELTPVTLVQNAITHIAEYLGAKIGAIYLMDETKSHLSLMGSYAYTRRKSASHAFPVGEGLIGQAALEKKNIVLTDVPSDYLTINSGLGHHAPQNILIAPFLHEGKVLGVIELGFFHTFTDIQMSFVNIIADNLSVFINSAHSRMQMAELLRETTAQAEELQAQQEELKTTNEELEEQTKALKKSKGTLQSQQEELKATNEELEERSLSIEKQRNELNHKNRDLEKARKEVEEKAEDLEMANKYKSEFLANMSHELRTPLNSMLILSQLLFENKEKNLTEKQKEFAHTINTAGLDLLNLINEVLDLSKIESGKMVFNFQEMEIQDFVIGIDQIFKQQAEAKEISWIMHVENDVPETIVTDHQRLKQIIKNFLSNAFKFTEKGTVSLTVHRPPTDVRLRSVNLQHDNAIGLTVEDTGIGIPDEKKKVIFDAFQQADGTTSRKYGGTGLGLSISRELTKHLHGEIHSQSELRKGSTFTLYLPEKVDSSSVIQEVKEKPTGKGKDEDATPQRKILPMEGDTIVNERGVVEGIVDDRKNISPEDKSILIIEDDAKFAKILFDLSKEKGFKCLATSDGESGLHFADYFQPSAIILDVGLPKMDGWSVMEQLKGSPKTRHIPVHFMTGTEDSLSAMKMGAVGYLTKPVSKESLDTAFETIDSVINAKVKNLLIVEDDDLMAKSIKELIGDEGILVETALSGKQALELLQTNVYQCIILDLGLKDMSGFDLLKKLKNEEALARTPVIIYTGKDLTRKEEEELKKYAESIIIKGAKSPERLLDETTLFLHSIESELPEKKQQMLKMLHDKEAVFDGKKVLIVDDDMRNVFAIASLLEREGLVASVAKNGKEGLRFLEEHPDTDLVIMDIMMPEMDGYETMKQIRKNSSLKDIPIIALTAKAMKGDKNKCIESGASDYLAKPVQTDKLISLMRVWLYK